jgi:hypothetical protein
VVECAKRRVEAEPPPDQNAAADRHRDDSQHRHQRDRPQRHDLPEGDAQPYQHDAPAQQRARCEAESWGQPSVGGQEVERQPDQQCHQRQWRAIMVGDEPGRQRSRRDDDEAGHVIAPRRLGAGFEIAVQVGRHRQRARGNART